MKSKELMSFYILNFLEPELVAWFNFNQAFLFIIMSTDLKRRHV